MAKEKAEPAPKAEAQPKKWLGYKRRIGEDGKPAFDDVWE